MKAMSHCTKLVKDLAKCSGMTRTRFVKYLTKCS